MSYILQQLENEEYPVGRIACLPVRNGPASQMLARTNSGHCEILPAEFCLFSFSSSDPFAVSLEATAEAEAEALLWG